MVEMRLFTFGTLRPDLYPHVKDRWGIGEGERAVLPGFLLYNLGWFPGIYQVEDLNNPGPGITGTLVDSSPELLERLDAYENPGLNRRCRLLTLEEEEVWAYVLLRHPTGYPVVESGDWAHQGEVE